MFIVAGTTFVYAALNEKVPERQRKRNDEAVTTVE